MSPPPFSSDCLHHRTHNSVTVWSSSISTYIRNYAMSPNMPIYDRHRVNCGVHDCTCQFDNVACAQFSDPCTVSSKRLLPLWQHTELLHQLR